MAKRMLIKLPETIKFNVAILILSIAFYSYSSICLADTVSDVMQINPITVVKVISPKSIEELQQLIVNHTGPISIGGARYSQGGQIATENCLFLDMQNMNHIINLDIEKQQITVEAGTTWLKILEEIDPKELSIKIMQSFYNFTVGGSLSVNVHGRYVGEGAIIRSVESIKIILADGSIKEASRTKNPELFFGAIGGYGGIGVIVEVTLNLTQNTPLERTSKRMDIEKYKDYFFDNIKNSKIAILHNADIYPPNYTLVNAITWNSTDKALSIKEKLSFPDKISPFKQFLLTSISNDTLRKFFRQYFYDPYKYYSQMVAWRNYEASDDVSALKPLSQKNSTFLLQEYFIPVENFNSFIPKMASILKQHKANVFNISIRHALPDSESLLAWAQKEVFAFVIYYEQGASSVAKKDTYQWTGKLIDAALEEGGSYYLPYQIIATPTQFLKAYPRSKEYFTLKKLVDPLYKFRNKLFDHYYPALLQQASSK